MHNDQTEQTIDALTLAAEKWNEAVSGTDKGERQVQLERLLALRKQQHTEVTRS